MEGSNQMNKSRLNANTRRLTSAILLFPAMALLLAPASGGAQELGSVDFPTSGASDAQPYFEAGLLLLRPGSTTDTCSWAAWRTPPPG